MKKLIAALSAVTICATTGAVYSPSARDDVPYTDEMAVVAYDDLPCNNILTATDPAYSDMWTYTMLYDRLLEIKDGSIAPSSLVEEWHIVGHNDRNIDPLSSIYDVYDKPTPYATGYPTDLLYDLDNNLYDVHTAGMPNIDFDIRYMPGGESPIPSGDWDDHFSGDGALIVEFKLRDGIYFNDGSELNASAIADYIVALRKEDSPLPQDALVRKVWQHAMPLYVTDETTLRLHLSFIKDDGSYDDYGFMDFIYDLASPIGSIIKISEEDDTMPVGSGAYSATESESGSYIKLERNDAWWGKEYCGEPPTQTITIKAKQDISSDTLLSYDADIVFSDLLDFYDWYGDGTGYEYTYTYSPVSLAPIILQYDLDGKFADENLRLAMEYATNNYIASYNCMLNNISNDGWAFWDVYDYNLAAYYLEGYYYYDASPMEFSILCPTKYLHQIEMFIYTFDMFYNSFVDDAHSIRFTINIVDDDEFDEEWASGDYDMAFREIDLSDANAMRKMLYGKTGDQILDDFLDRAHIAANDATYCYDYYAVQQYAFEHAYFGYLGWDTAIEIQNTNVGGFYKPYGLSPTGDMPLLDFRWIYRKA